VLQCCCKILSLATVLLDFGNGPLGKHRKWPRQSVMQASRTLSIPVHSEKPAKRENRLDRSRRTSRFVRRPDYIIGGAEGYTAAIIPVFRGFIMADSVELVARIISEVQHKIPTRHISFPSYYFGLFTRTVQTVHRPAASIHTLREKNEIDLSLLSLLETQFISPKTL